MSKEINKRICPVELAGGLDNSLRRLLQNPQKILKTYIHEGMTFLDLGCGPGFFSIEIAKMLNNSGKGSIKSHRNEYVNLLGRIL